MKANFLRFAMLIAIFGAGGPALAQVGYTYEVMYTYDYYENGQLVGQARDRCTHNGVIPSADWLWGRGSTEVVTEEWIACENGQRVPIK